MNPDIYLKEPIPHDEILENNRTNRSGTGNPKTPNNQEIETEIDKGRTGQICLKSIPAKING